MPLFFLISGFLFKTSTPTKEQIKKSFKRLIIPYISYLGILFLSEVISIQASVLIWPKLYGGAKLGGIYAPFWFITTLFFAQILFNILLQNNRISKFLIDKKIISFFIFAIIGYMFSFSPYPLPWNLHVVPMAIMFIYAGYILRMIFDNQSIKLSELGWKSGMIISLIAFICCIVGWHFQEILYIDMKSAHYGIPIISLFIAILLCICLAYMASKLERFRLIAIPLSLLGEASLVIMFLHQPIQVYLENFIPARPLLYLVGILMPFSVYYIATFADWSRKLLIGK